MAIQVALHHVTQHRYDRPVTLSPHVVRLRPAPHTRSAVRAYSLRVSPEPHFLNWQQDPFGNHQARIVFPEPARELRVEVDLVVDLVTFNPFDFFLDEGVETFPFRYDATTAHELAAYLARGADSPKLDALVDEVRGRIGEGRRTVDVLVDLNQLVHDRLRYDVRMEPGVFSPDETLTRGHGSCRDFAWLLVQLLRRLGIAARFASGYSIQLRPDRPPLVGPAGVSQDCADLHAWAEAYLPGGGWVGLDATSGLFCGEGHIPLACAADPTSAAAVTGSIGWHKQHEDDELGEEFAFTMTVTRLEDRPRSTRPMTEAQWHELLACGDVVDRALVDADVRLTMGGEPTFVSADDPDADEWNTAALGPTKARLGDALVRRLRRRFAPGGLLHHGQGKWYPGEPLPRWAWSCYFRKDGEPIWRDDGLIADGAQPGHAGTLEARALIEAIAVRLGVAPALALPAYEDVWYALWRERRLPVNVDPHDAKLDDELERARLWRLFDHGLAHAVGYALPLRAAVTDDGPRWQSGRWFLRDERLYLTPGESPMGLRLPLDSLPWSPPGEREAPLPLDPQAPRRPLPSRATILPPRPTSAPLPRPVPVPARGASAGDVVRTALCVEPRGGTLHVFLPPLAQLEEFLALTAAIEDAAAMTRLPVRLEGYHPPADHRLGRLQVTPDPGVLEVNVQPTATWRDAVELTTAVYDDARALGLAAEKFLIDGRHTGTGGGNHIVLGGPSPADSPLLRRPDLLRSLVGYWLNHPSLSYFFSGLFVGPTSQAPRMDEARHDALYELEIAHAALDGATTTPPWLVDRLYRHLLTDVTGNTHRTELCIDKLFSPDAASGRQGLLELRAFEMPPDPRMSCAQQLLVRALVATFWRKPYTRPPVRWGSRLIDRFALPHYLARDLSEVLADAREAGFPLRDEWYEAQLEFRFPVHGRAAVGDGELELRQAVEPWHVLGEEPAGGATARYVDSSVERVQVRARGLVEGRHVVTCNGRRVPLTATERAEEQVAGVRFKAWQPPSSLHPTLPAQSPLVFDVYDLWNDRAIGGCTYHVAHPGGRSHDTLPRNALEAESRRVARFQPFGHTPGKRPAPPLEAPSAELPHTLDLRRAGSPWTATDGRH